LLEGKKWGSWCSWRSRFRDSSVSQLIVGLPYCFRQELRVLCGEFGDGLVNVCDEEVENGRDNRWFSVPVSGQGFEELSFYW
jgi:hypothetical protein